MAQGGLAAPAADAKKKDSGFAAMQARGKMAMGVDQYTSQHHFEPLPDGGRIMLQRDAADTAGTTAIREHLKDIAMRFRAGDFAIPGFVHAQQVPGTPVMAARRSAIRSFGPTSDTWSTNESGTAAAASFRSFTSARSSRAEPLLPRRRQA